MESLSPWQTVVPDSLLIEIFGHLDIRALGRATRTCKLWSRVAEDDILWRNLARQLFKITGNLRLLDPCWKDEVKRLVYHVPMVESEQYEVHRDEVLDVAISHNGQYFCTTSKDTHAMLWRLSYPSYIVSDVCLGSMLSWELTQYSSFNDSDTLVFVCGVSLPMDAEIQTGRGAVFTVPDMKLVCVIKLDPPTLFGAWLTDRMFVGGSLTEPQDLIKIESYKVTDEDLEAAKYREDTDSDVSESALNKTATTVFTFTGHQYHQMNLLVAVFPQLATNQASRRVRSLDDCQTSNHSNKCKLLVKSETGGVANVLDLDCGDARRTDSLYRNKDRSMLCVDVDEDVNEMSSNRAESYDDSTCIADDTNQSCSVDDDPGSGIQETICNSGLGATHELLEKDLSCDNRVFCDNTQAEACNEHRTSQNLPNLKNFNQAGFLSNQTGSFREHKHEDMDTSCVEQKFCLKQGCHTYIVFVTGDHDAIAVHEITADKLFQAGDLGIAAGIEEIDHYFHIKDCYITGLSLSRDQRFLFFNYREFDPKEPINQRPDVSLSEKISSQHLRVGTIDLVAMTRLTNTEYVGHVAFSDYPAWYICLDASPMFIGSGSEDGKAYLWDRHHRILLTTLQHQEGVVNGIAFSPIDEETCITVCDDRLIKIWRSKNKLRASHILC